MDLTVLFKASVKTLKTQVPTEDRQNILKSTSKDLALIKPKDVVRQMNKLQHLLQENRNGYINVINYLSTNKTMTNFDREQMDSCAQTIITDCTQALRDFQNEIPHYAKTKQLDDHYRNIWHSVDAYLTRISKFYAEIKAIRVKRVIEMHKLSKLESIRNKSSSSTESRNHIISADEITSPAVCNNFGGIKDLSSEEIQMFESENALLYNEMSSVSDELQQMESKVVHIAELQELFTEKVLEQEKDIERIAGVVANSTENVKDANVQIRQAIQRNAGLRVWLLFFFIIMSFSLLFLDWYND